MEYSEKKSASQKPDSKATKAASKATKAPKKAKRATKTAAQRKDEREAMAKTQPMSAITDAMVAADAATRRELQALNGTRA